MIQFRSDLYKLLPINAHVAEIGVAEGNFSAEMLAWGVERLYCIDVWCHMPNQKGDASSPQSWHDYNFSETLRKVKFMVDSEFKVSFFRGLSKDMAKLVDDDSLDLVYLDADHSYEGVMTDLVSWFPKLKIGGVMAGHDYYSDAYGVKNAVSDFTQGKYTVKIIPESKAEDAGFYFIKS